MTKKVWKKAATVVLGAALVGGVFVEVPNALTTTQAQAAAKISYSQYQSDLSGIKSALSHAGGVVQGDVAKVMPSYSNQSYYGDDYYGFPGYFQDLGSAMDDWDGSGHNNPTTMKANLAALVASYDVFSGILSSGSKSQLTSLATNISNAINSGKLDNVADMEQDYAQALGSDIQSDYGSKYDGVGPKTPKKTSYISKLSVKKTSKKYVKVTGSAKLYKSAKYARVHTYKGNKYTKLSSKHTFSKSVYAPKAKTVKVTVGNYSHGHFTSVTSTKTAHVK